MQGRFALQTFSNITLLNLEYYSLYIIYQTVLFFHFKIKTELSEYRTLKFSSGPSG